jgi:hypothetical protein
MPLVRTRHPAKTRKPTPSISSSPGHRTPHFFQQPDRLNPQSQSLSQSYGSVLPTCLTYIILTTRGCSPWRPAADMGTAEHEIYTLSHGFSRADRSTPDTARAAVLYDIIIPISGQTDFRDSISYKEKTTLPGASADVSMLECVTALDPEGPISVSQFGNINPIPFRELPPLSKYIFMHLPFSTGTRFNGFHRVP